MNKEQKKFQKKKDREKVVHSRVLRRREMLRKQREEKEAKEKELESSAAPHRMDSQLEKPMPIINDLQKKDDMIKKRLLKNMQVLEGLEKEYLAEIEARKNRNDLLEAEGYATLEEKVQAAVKSQNLGKII